MRDWSPERYLKFEDERNRPAHDLLAQVRSGRVRKIVDVGCGPGNSTELLAHRFPEAGITGIDNSRAMLEEARRRDAALLAGTRRTKPVSEVLDRLVGGTGHEGRDPRFG